MRTVAAAVLAAVALGAPRSQQTPPVFRGGVDLVTVDVAVVDKTGQPVAGLSPADFSIVADKRPRRVVSADYISAKGRPTAATTDARPVPAPSSNAQPPAGRTFLFVVDIEQIGQGEGRGALKTIADHLDRLSPDDRVGLVSLPYGTPRVDLTTNHRLVNEAAGRIAGASTRNQGAEMTVGEAAAIERLDQQALDDYFDRIRKDRCTSCILDWQIVASRVMDAERRHSRNLFDTLRALAAAMAPIDGPKALVLVSQGVVNDTQTLDDMQRFAATAEKARVTLYGLNLQGSLADVVSRYNMTHAHRLDHQALLDGMATLAIAGRGDVFLVSGTPAAALARIDAEMAGYYLLSFERDPADRDGQRAGIDVRVSSPDAVVRWRTEFTPEKPAVAIAPSVPTDLKAAIGEMLRWPVPVMSLGVDLDTYTVPSLPGAEARTILAASLASAGQPIVAAGYEVTNESGKVVADDLALGRVATERLRGDRQLYAAAVAIPPGRYSVKLAAIDATGRRGSVEHAFDVRTARAGALRLGDVFIGELSAAGFVPSPSLVAGATALPVRVDLCGDTAGAFDRATLTLELAARSGAAPFATTTLSVTETSDPRRRLASATLAIAPLPPGEYVVAARLRTADGAEARTSRAFVKR